MPPGPPAPGGPPAGEGAPVILGLPIGPAGRNDPSDGHRWYLELETWDCDTLSASVPDDGPQLWKAAAALCHARVSGDEAQWQQGSAAFAGASAGNDCLDQAAYRVLKSLVDYHRQNPGTRIGTPTPEAGTACPLVLEGLQNADGQDHPSGSVCGGDRLTLVGRLTGVRTVRIGESSVPVQTTGGLGEEAFSFTTPPAAGPGTVNVTVTEADFPVTGSAEFTYTEDPGPCPSAGSGTSAPATEPGGQPTVEPTQSGAPPTGTPEESAPESSQPPAESAPGGTP